MSWLDLFFLALLLNLGLTVGLMIFHRVGDGISPWWEGAVMVGVTIWGIVVFGRTFADVFGISFASGSTVVQTFFWAGVTNVLFLWMVGQLHAGWRAYHAFLESSKDSPA